MYEVVYAAEKAAFEVGFKYAMGLILEGVSAENGGAEVVKK